ncbi:L,D-transpeptidase family protein [Novosphingobium sp. B 225]|uniref:L,D-transpeptidase family protein n=1 Tax=Novosphingobium sp. B 225 TaxID=1961849 RepID=UPI0020CEB0EF|nr:L,D-transpeptidase family protein [Novosphingobium sp. B 225]
MIWRAAMVAGVLVLFALAGFVVPGLLPDGNERSASALAAVPPPAPKPAPPKPAEPPAVESVLRSGVLIVISKASQNMFVFKDGALWATAPVSTGKRGHSTPAGIFPILQKRVFHRSNLYSNAPMPYMQRLTWSGIAIHAGRLPGYPASHGCIRLPHAFAKQLFALTRADRTTVVVANEPLKTESNAKTLALMRYPVQPDTALAASIPARPPRIEPAPMAYPTASIAPVAAILPAPSALSGGQTIQLTAAPTPAQAEAHWAQLVSASPELARLQKVVIPAVVGTRRVYRLRASAPNAYAVCSALKSRGIACFNVS